MKNSSTSLEPLLADAETYIPYSFIAVLKDTLVYHINIVLYVFGIKEEYHLQRKLVTVCVYDIKEDYHLKSYVFLQFVGPKASKYFVCSDT